MAIKKKAVKKKVVKTKGASKGKGVGGNGNLIPVKKGEVRNPKGKPKGTKDGIRAQLNRLLRNNPNASLRDLLKKQGINLDKRPNSEGLATILLQDAFKADLKAIDMVLEQTEQALPKAIELGDPNGDPMNAVLVYIPDNGRN